MKRRLLFITFIILASIIARAQSLTITESAGWLESAYVKWLPVENADSYNVYYSGEGVSKQKIDDQLVRSYGSYFRADLLGLKAGSYTVKVAPVFAGIEGEGTISDQVIVEAHDRTGFAFSNGRIPGAYNADGTIKANAVVLYITENSKNKVSLDVTGANENPCVGLETILEGFKKGNDNRPLIVRLVGQISDMEYMDKGDIVIENDNNTSSYITFEGVGDDAVADGWGIRVKNASNIEIRNIGSMNCNSDEGDNIGLQQDNDYIWVHHCDLFYGDAGSDADQAKGDGAMDCKKSTYVTFSYNHFWDSGKCNLLGLSEDTTLGLYITYHHNWYDHSDSRHPRVRFYSAHVYNNYYDGNAKYGAGSTMGSSVFVEANYFRNCKYPMLTSMQGSDVYDESKQANDYKDMPTFSKEDGGTIKAFNNQMTGQRRFVPYGSAGFPNSTIDFDAYVATSRDETISSTVVSSYGKNTYNNFDTNTAVMYGYTPDSPELAKENVMSFAGRMFGGDFKWVFNNTVDDVSYAVNTALKSALVGYETSLVSIQGDSTSTGGSDPGGEITGDLDHNFTLSGTSSSYFSITGNLSDSKGTVNYAGLVLTQCLKLESSTSITFTTTKEASLTLVFNNDFTGKVNIDGTVYNATAGILTITIEAGSHEITKGDSANLYYISLIFSTGNQKARLAQMNLYPNPATISIYISTDANVEKVEIYSVSGVLMFRSISKSKTIDIKGLNKGAYLIKVVTDQGIFSRTIIKN